MENDFSTFLQELREKSNIVDVARRYIDVEKKGSRYWARCPIHNEKTPSFTLNEERGLYHCFGCGANGDVFSFVQEVEHCTFSDAVRILAERAGMEVPDWRTHSNQAKRDEQRRYKERLYQLMRDTAVYYYKNLRSPNGKLAMDYVSSRGLNNNTLNVFGLGYSLGYDGLVEYLKEKGYSKQEMVDSGVVSEKDGKLYDFEAGRLIVPIFNNTNNVIAFGGRVLGKTDFAKYKNTSETIIFSKRHELFGVHTIKKAKLTQRFDKIIVVEGYMDVISLYQAGIKNVCASMGTALTPEQAKQIKFYNNNVYLCYDGDSAGQKATYKGIDVLRDAGLNVKVITLIEGLDPDEIIKKYGVSKFNELVDSAVSPTEYKIRATAKQYDLTQPEDKGKFAVAAIDILSELATLVEREPYLKMISELSEANIETLAKRLYEQSENSTGYKESKQEPIQPRNGKDQDKSAIQRKYYRAVRHIIYEIFADQALDIITDNLTPYLSDPEHIQIYDYARELISQGEKLNIEHLRELENNSEANEVLKGNFDKMTAEVKDKMFSDCLRTLKLSFYKKQQEELNKELKEIDDSLSGGEKNIILTRLNDCMHKINELKKVKRGN